MNTTDVDSPPIREELQGTLRQAVDRIRAIAPPTIRLDTIRPVAVARQKPRRRFVILAAAAAVLGGVWLGISPLTVDGPEKGAFAQTLEQIEKAKSITWKQKFYEHVSTMDGKQKWLKVHTTDCAYKAPGLYRDARLDEQGQVEQVTITDWVQGRRLTYSTATRKATLEELTPGSRHFGPFADDQEKLRTANLEWVGKRKVGDREANVFRHTYRWIIDSAERDWSADYWIDAQTKQLLASYHPGANIYDPDKDPARDTPPGKASSRRAIGGSHHDIRLDVELDDSLFRLEPPPGYEVETQARPQLTEQEMVEYLGILADFNDQIFPDDIGTARSLLTKYNEAQKKPRRELTAAERNLLEADQRYWYLKRGVHGAPILFFWSNNIIKDTFRYLGKGVKLGDKDRIVCWYRLKASDESKAYRVVYGDLSIKDVAAEDLPLPVEL